MKNSLESKFSFLEQCPYFYDKKEEHIPGIGGITSHYIYTYYMNETPIQTIAEIWIPAHNPCETFKWKFIQLNTEIDKPIFQGSNININEMPRWFRNTLELAKEQYENWTQLRKLLRGA